MSRFKITPFLLFLTLCANAAETVSATTDDSAFVAFVRSQARPIRTVELSSGAPDNDSDLAPFGEIVGKAPLVGFGEADHGGHEQPSMRNRLFKYLVEHKGFRAILLESGYIEGLLADRYVQGDPTLTVQDAMTRGFTHGMGDVREVRELLEFMRDYNSRQKGPSTRLHYVGFDLSVLGDSTDVPLNELIPYLQKVDPKYLKEKFQTLLALAKRSAAFTHFAEGLYQKLGSEIIEPDHLDPLTTIAFEQLDASEQKALENGVTALVKRFAKMKSRYEAKSSEMDTLFNSRLAFMAWQNVRNLRSRQTHPKIVFFDTVLALLQQYDEQYQTLSHLKLDRIDQRHIIRKDKLNEDVQDYTTGRNSRELMSEENITWTQKTFGKALAYAHNGHLIKVLKHPKTEVPGGGVVENISVKGAGVFLAEKHGSDYVLIGSTEDRYVDANGAPLSKFNGFEVMATADCSSCLERSFARLDAELPLFVLDLRKASGSARAYLEPERQVRASGQFGDIYSVPHAYDAIFYVNKVSKAGNP